MEVTVTRIERKIWSPDRGTFTAIGETMDVDIDALKPEAERPRVSGERFLKGPIPWSWIAAASALPGQALLVGLCVWRLPGAMKNHTVSFGNSDLKPLGIDRSTKSRALRALEQSGLVKVARQPGRFPKVTLLRARHSRNACKPPQ
jgi:DNA-binding transcriptional ArsR family regulator